VSAILLCLYIGSCETVLAGYSVHAGITSRDKNQQPIPLLDLGRVLSQEEASTHSISKQNPSLAAGEINLML